MLTVAWREEIPVRQEPWSSGRMRGKRFSFHPYHGSEDFAYATLIVIGRGGIVKKELIFHNCYYSRFRRPWSNRECQAKGYDLLIGSV